MTRPLLYVPFLVACLALSVAPPASARPAKVVPAAKVAVDRPVVGVSANGLDSILVPVRYPIELNGRLAELRVALIGARGKTLRSWVLHERLNGGKQRLPDRRRRFTFVHRVGLNADLSRQLRQGATVRVVGSGRLDIEGDGKAEMNSRDVLTGKPAVRPGAKPVCGSVPHLRVKRGARISLPLPVCDRALSWTVVRKGSRGVARVSGGRLIYEAPRAFRGADQIQLVAKDLTQYAQVTVGAPSGVRVRAIGDSVTAGFGYYSDGKEMGTFDFFAYCRPAEKELNDGCSSNSSARESKEGSVEYADGYGLSKNVSWAAQWANGYNITDYKNFAVSGSEPAAWVTPNGEFHEQTEEVERENPDYILLTLGANPLLSQLLTSPKDLWCAATSDPPKYEKFRECIEHEFETVELQTNLRRVYAELLGKTAATIYVMQYHLSIPAIALFDSSVEIALANALINREIESVVKEIGNRRLQLVTPPHFNVGIDIRAVYPSRYDCHGTLIDGPSVQSSYTQIELGGYWGKKFCPGLKWVISGDTGIHPSALGYKQMTSKVPPPTGG